MEEEDEEARALLEGGPDEAGRGAPAVSAVPGALPALCDPSRLAHRLLVLLLMCFLGFGSYFCYDNPAALQTQVKRDMQVNTTKFMLLYAWYSWPNVVLCFFGGFLIDRVFGIRWGTIIFSCFVCIGQGSTVNMNLMGWLYSKVEASLGSAGHTTLGVTLMIGGITCILSLICALVLAYLDQRAERILHKAQGKTGEVIKLTDVKDFSLPLWLIFIICVCYYVAVFPFIGLGKVFFIEKFGFSSQAASAINSVVYVISAPMSPIFGLLVDKTGKNIIWVLCAVVTTLAAHVMLAFTLWNPWIAMCLLGLSYSLLACALWPMVAFVVPEHQLGTAYGFMQSIQNLGLAIISIIAGMILDTRGYLFLEVFFIACVSLSLLSVVLLYVVNRARGGNLNYSARQREEIKLSHAEFYLFICERENEREREREHGWGSEGEADSLPSREPDAGLDPGTPGS
ncbi:major facilitator superfamily domain-containing protein 1 isoform X6 [Mirounga angustirostris]|uniref:major facilitator superfamily domain-containing protein 1 isoform X6 n=1 Tax=Mirounga angustirostris TaxID=9716 RepID=UPI00313B041D